MIFVSDIQRETAKRFRIPLVAMKTMTRRPEHAEPRHIAMLLARRMTRHSYSKIGHLFDRDHSTVIHGCRMARKRCLADRGQLAAFCEIHARVLGA